MTGQPVVGFTSIVIPPVESTAFLPKRKNPEATSFITDAGPTTTSGTGQLLAHTYSVSSPFFLVTRSASTWVTLQVGHMALSHASSIGRPCALTPATFITSEASTKSLRSCRL
jgi:hypothetical protein